MGRINVLDKHTAELIAAGEVVERPSSAIKELVENSIDSGATAITVEIQDGGVTMMRVTDNGSGILRDDIRNAFKRHATSKVKEKADLDSIGTLGFRGEALASISAVAKVDLITKASEESIGTHYKIEGGEEILLEDAGCPEGTTFIIKNLFYNVPARMKFLKKNVTEGTAVAAVIDKIALSHSEIAFTLIRDNKQTLVTAGDGVEKNCIYSVLGRDFSNNSIPVDYEYNGISVKGYVTKPSAARPNRSMQNFFINGRYVKTRTAMAALEEACKGMVMVGKYPGCVLHINMPFDMVDVNVHPAKTEVRFVNEKPIFETVYHGVRSALMKGDTAKNFVFTPKPNPIQKPFTMSQYELKQMESPQVKISEEPVFQPKPIFTEVTPTPQPKIKPKNIDIVVDEENFPIFKPKKSVDENSDNTQQQFNLNQHFDIQEEQPKQPEQPPEEPSEISDISDTTIYYEEKPEQIVMEEAKPQEYRFIGEAFRTYIIIERNSEIVLIDKHALHERIIYEKLMKERGKTYAQYLLEPVALTLSKEQYIGVLEKKSILDDSGFEIDDFGEGTILIRTAPSFIDAGDVSATVEEMADHILENKNNIDSEYVEWLYHNIACRSAIKGGDKNSDEELINLYLQMDSDPNYRYCPHGRPTSIIMTKYQIEKQFGRTGGA